MTRLTLPRYVDRQFMSSVGLTVAFYGSLMTLLVTTSWWLEEIAAIAFFAFLLWAYRWPIGRKLGWCARRPGARLEAPAPSASPEASAPRDSSRASSRAS